MRVIVIFYGIFCSIFSVHTRLHKRALKALHVCVLKWLFAACEQERALRVCTYSGSSSSDTETEPEGTGSTLGSPQKTLINRAKKNDSGMLGNCSRWMIYKAPSIVIMSFVEVGSSLTKSAFFFKLFPPFTVEQNEDTLKRRSVEKSLSIMDCYQHDMFSHLEKDSRKISQYNLLHKESSLDGKAGDRLSVSIQVPYCSQLISYRSSAAALQARCRSSSSILFLSRKSSRGFVGKCSVY